MNTARKINQETLPVNTSKENFKTRIMSRDKENPFFTGSTSLLYDKRISPQAKNLAMAILSVSQIPNWRFSYGYFAKNFGVSKETIITWAKQLKKYGYLKTIQTRNKYGNFEDTYFIFDEFASLESQNPDNLGEEISEPSTVTVTGNHPLRPKERKKPVNPDFTEGTPICKEIKSDRRSPVTVTVAYTNNNTKEIILEKQTNKGTGSPVKGVVDFSKKLISVGKGEEGNRLFNELEKIGLDIFEIPRILKNYPIEKITDCLEYGKKIQSQGKIKTSLAIWFRGTVPKFEISSEAKPQLVEDKIQEKPSKVKQVLKIFGRLDLLNSARHCQLDAVYEQFRYLKNPAIFKKISGYISLDELLECFHGYPQGYLNEITGVWNDLEQW